MGEIKIKSPGFLTLVQDLGRYGYQQQGVPVSGSMDTFAHRISNILVDNKETEAVLEVTMFGPQIEFQSDEVIAITGGDLNPMINNCQVMVWKTIHVKAGDILSFGSLKNGCRSYVSFTGGIDVPLVMGSKSTYIKACIGGFEGRSLKAGDVLNISSTADNLTQIKEKVLSTIHIPEYNNTSEVRVILGPQEESFTKKGIETFLSSEYTLTNDCDRMGVRLDGNEIEHVDGGDIISDSIAFGAIQVPGHGKPIIMMADRQTTGGYTKIANVISVDLPKIAQLKPGDRINFKKVTIEEAHKLIKENEIKIEDIKKHCKNYNVICTKEYILKVNGKSYEVKVEEVD